MQQSSETFVNSPSMRGDRALNDFFRKCKIDEVDCIRELITNVEIFNSNHVAIVFCIFGANQNFDLIYGPIGLKF